MKPIKVVAQRDGSGEVSYLHADHLGSTTLTTNSAGGFAQGIMYTAWGETRLGGFSTVTLNYTGQRRDDTGLLYYNARYYDPTLARFVSADSVVPGSALGSMDGVALMDRPNLTRWPKRAGNAPRRVPSPFRPQSGLRTQNSELETAPGY